MGLKWCGGILILLGSSCMGLWGKIQSVQQYKMAREWQRCLSLLKAEIQYGRVPLPEACLSVSQRVQGNCRCFFQCFSERLREGGGAVQQIWKETMEQVFGQRQLNKMDYEELNRFGSTLGYLDVELQVRSIELCNRRLEESISSYEKERKNQTRLYPVLGAFGGILLCLVLV